MWHGRCYLHSPGDANKMKRQTTQAVVFAMLFTVIAPILTRPDAATIERFTSD